MRKVENGMFVSVDYTGTLENGEIFDSSQGRNPLEVEMGAGNLIKGFETELMGMSLNEKKTFSLSPEDAYGEVSDDAVHSFSRTEIPPELNPQVGQTLALTTPNGQQIPAKVTHVDDEKVIVDLNHPLAGQKLTFDIEIVGISDTPTQAPTGCSSCDSASEGGCSSGCC
ncbi:MAG: peptidylprolyl isomerase [Proteobacteria bacterium]|nr:peptidylprolyl isomerase [Pseudomonadota bacterium]